MKNKELINVAKHLIECKSVSPDDGMSIDYITNFLENIGFNCKRIDFEDVKNLYAKIDFGGKNLCFAGHVDVVPPGDLSKWNNDPFKMTIQDEKIFGRGIVDMKGAIACFMCAVKEFLSNNPKPNFSISFLITSDEEAVAKNGTYRVLPEIAKMKEQIDYCIIGEMTAKKKFADCIKVGRRGSVNFTLEIKGIQGHVAYPTLIDNPAHTISRILSDLSNITLDAGNDSFEASSLQITNFSTDSEAVNVCGSKAVAYFNVRYNNKFSAEALYKIIYDICTKYADADKIKLTYPAWNASFYLSKSKKFAELVSGVVEDSLGYEPIIDTVGGATDGRFIHHYCDEVVELGFIEDQAHKINEHCSIEEPDVISRIYLDLLKKLNAN